eukprot:RCo040882
MQLVPKEKWPAKESVSSCPFCTSKFGVLTWKHHCHCCGRILCDDCCRKRALPPTYPEPVRVCPECDTLARAVDPQSSSSAMQPARSGSNKGGGHVLGGARTQQLDPEAER